MTEKKGFFNKFDELLGEFVTAQEHVESMKRLAELVNQNNDATDADVKAISGSVTKAEQAIKDLSNRLTELKNSSQEKEHAKQIKELSGRIQGLTRDIEGVSSSIPTFDEQEIAINAINLLELFEGDDRLDAKAIKNIEKNIDVSKLNIPKEDFDREGFKSEILKLMPKNPPMYGGGSGATFLKSLRDVDLSGLSKNSRGKYILGSGGGGGGGDVSDWGDIGGTLSDQTDLQNALDGKADTSHTHTLSDVTDAGNLAALDTVDTAQITAEAITEALLDAMDTPGDGEVLSWNAGESRFEWVADQVGEAGSGEVNQNAFTSITDGTNTAVADAKSDTFKLRTANALLGITVANDDATHGDSVLFTVDDDLSNYDNGTSGFITDYTVTESDVTAHEAALTITESQISDLTHFSGSYTDLTDKPTIPTNNNQLTNGAGYITDYTVTEGDVTAHQGALTITESQISDLSHFSGDYGDLTNKPTIPTNNNQLTNGAGYITATLTDEEVQDKVGAMFSGNTETLITATYQDTDGTIDLVVDNDLSNYDNSTSGFITDYTVTEGDVTAHQAALSITESQISDLDHSVDVVSNVATSTILGRVTAGSGNSEELTATQVRTLLNVEDGADVTDATNVDAAGAVMNSDTSTASMSFVIDEDDMTSNSATKVPTQQSVKAYVDANGGSGNTYNFNNIKIDQSGGTSDTHGALSGTINGSNTTFTVSAGEYESGSLIVYRNGKLQIQGSSEDWVETTPGSGTFDFNTAPLTGDHITAVYVTTTDNSGTIEDLTYTTATGEVSALGNLGSTEAIDWDSATHFTGTLDANVTITHTNEASGKKITIALAYDGSAQRTITWSDVDKWAGGTAPTAPDASGEELLVTLLFLGTTCYGSYELFSTPA